MEQTRRITPEELARQADYTNQIRQALGKTERYVCVQTFGCQQNEADSERILGMACAMGYTVTEDPHEADLIVVNTCAVREHAELKTLSVTGECKHLKAKKPELLIGICGCMVSQEHRMQDIKHRYPYVDFLFGTEHLYRFPEIVYRALPRKTRQFYPNTGAGNLAEGIPVCRRSAYQAWVSIMYGCNNFCTYCVVPYVRGRERSRHFADILREVEGLVRAGYREITLLGQNVNSYGKDLAQKTDFADLLDAVCRIEGDFTVRFMTSHPKDASRKLIDTMARHRKVARQFHLPLQSGSDRILSKMNRHYTMAHYKEVLSYLRKTIPDISLSTDIIVGFPGETEQDFSDTLDALRELQFDNIYSFIYSPRRDTPAAAWEDQIPEEIKKERFARLLALQNEISRHQNQAYQGKTVTVLVEGISKNNQNRLTGRTDNNRVVHFTGDLSLCGQHVQIKITHADTHALIGELAE